MSDESTYLVWEIWLNPTKTEEFKVYRIRFFNLFEKFKPEYIFHGHPFTWTLETNEGELPSGIEVWRFETKEMANRALEAIETSGLLREGKMILEKSRCYLARD